MSKINHEIHVDENLLLRAKNELNMSIDDFIEYALTMYLQHEDHYARLFYEGAKHYTQLKKIKDKIHTLDNKNTSDENAYVKAMSTVDRIHKQLNHVGKDKLRKIADDNDISSNDLINHVISQGYNVTNFTATIK